jgi:ferredoxin
MSVEVYYFSGTGNSLIVARDIAEKIEANLIPIASQIDKEIITTDADIIGIVFPVYYGDIPLIIKRFAEKLDNISNKYIFAVCTYGGGTGDSLRTLSRIIRSRGGELSAQYGVHMPQNAFYKFWEIHEKLYKKWEKKLEIINMNMIYQKKGILLSDLLLNLILFPINKVFGLMTKRGLAALSGSSSDMPIEELIPLVDRSFSTNEKCNGCGICVEVCPVANIKITDNNPVWLNHCENCIACYNWCPNKAIQNGIAQKGYYYRHPDVKISDMIIHK